MHICPFCDNECNCSGGAEECECCPPEDDDEPLCGACNGSGEGMHDGSSCGQCGGSGTFRRSSGAGQDEYYDRHNYEDY